MVRGRGWSSGAQGEGSVESGGSIGTSRAADMEKRVLETFYLRLKRMQAGGLALEPSVYQRLRIAHGLGSHEF